ncbi:hypothetical protein CZ814_00845 [Photobacterium toruni]|uniref:Uncharacterized protein n=1 Tax=Photobacterium toruni TaxID=1935446 RepID=A0A1T4PQ35_9GAMM|nr:hypothetical protein CZ814_00845 [Photobacterium toruni]
MRFPWGLRHRDRFREGLCASWLGWCLLFHTLSTGIKKRPCVGVEVGIIGAVYLVIGSNRCFNFVDASPWPVMPSF